jgi:hypothetical protein
VDTEIMMGMSVVRTIAGQKVIATPVFKGKHRPAYWYACINGHVLAQTFASASDAFHFVCNAKLCECAADYI